MKVSLHELKDHINVLELPRTRREHDVLDLHNICKHAEEFRPLLRAVLRQKARGGGQLVLPGCRKSLSSFISLRIRVASLTWSKTLLIFLIATFSPVFVSTAEQTTP